MKKLLWTVVTIAVLFLVYRLLITLRGSGGNKDKVTVNVTVVMNGNSCTIDPPKPTIDQGMLIQWSGPKGFAVTFAHPVIFVGEINTGSPFPDSVGGWTKTFSGPNSLTTPATLTKPEKLIPFNNQFPLQTVTVNGQSCYERKNGYDPNMKVIVNQ
jgi:hypothetical protein